MGLGQGVRNTKFPACKEDATSSNVHLTLFWDCNESQQRIKYIHLCAHICIILYFPFFFTSKDFVLKQLSTKIWTQKTVVISKHPFWSSRRKQSKQKKKPRAFPLRSFVPAVVYQLSNRFSDHFQHSWLQCWLFQHFSAMSEKILVKVLAINESQNHFIILINTYIQYLNILKTALFYLLK